MPLTPEERLDIIEPRFATFEKKLDDIYLALRVVIWIGKIVIGAGAGAAGIWKFVTAIKGHGG